MVWCVGMWCGVVCWVRQNPHDTVCLDLTWVHFGARFPCLLFKQVPKNKDLLYRPGHFRLYHCLYNVIDPDMAAWERKQATEERWEVDCCGESTLDYER